MLEVIIAPGETLWDALAGNKIQLARPCGGRGVCGGCKLYVDGVGDVPACRFDEPGTYRVEIGAAADFDVVMGNEAAADNCGAEVLRDETSLTADRGMLAEEAVYIAVDVGTTTVALSGICGNKRAQDGFVNPQRSFGADVVTRIAAANAGQSGEMCAMLMEPLMESLERMRARPNRDCSRPVVMIAANTTMLHILRGFSCEGLGQAPFAPVDLTAGNDIWKGMRAEFEVHYMPGISAHIGADIVSGIYGLGMMETDEVTVLLDLGTNGEMAVGNRSRLFCASAAAGPAFEGSELAMQIHASGILKYLHKLRKCGIIDEYGLLEDEYFDEGYPISDSLRITQDDIREIQMAKGAIRAGIEILLKEYGITAAGVSRVYLAGGMGYYLNPDDAVGIGLLPIEFADKTLAVGNSCLRGLLKAAGECEEMCNIADAAQEIILADHPDFAELYIEEMNF